MKNATSLNAEINETVCLEKKSLGIEMVEMFLDSLS